MILARTVRTGIPAGHCGWYASYLKKQGYSCDVFVSHKHSDTVYLLFLSEQQALRYQQSHTEIYYLTHTK